MEVFKNLNVGLCRCETTIAYVIRIIKSLVKIEHSASGFWCASTFQSIRIALTSELDAQSHSITYCIRTQHPRVHFNRFFDVDRIGEDQ